MEGKTSTEFICLCDRYSSWIAKGDERECPNCHAKYEGDEIKSEDGCTQIVAWTETRPRYCGVFYIKFPNGKITKAEVTRNLRSDDTLYAKYGWWPFYRTAPRGVMWGVF